MSEVERIIFGIEAKLDDLAKEVADISEAAWRLIDERADDVKGAMRATEELAGELYKHLARVGDLGDAGDAEADAAFDELEDAATKTERLAEQLEYLARTLAEVRVAIDDIDTTIRDVNMAVVRAEAAAADAR